MVGCLITTLLSLPVPTVISLVYPATSPFITFMIYGQLRRKKGDLFGKAIYPDKLSAVLIVVTLVAIIASRLLVNGVSL